MEVLQGQIVQIIEFLAHLPLKRNPEVQFYFQFFYEWNRTLASALWQLDQLPILPKPFMAILMSLVGLMSNFQIGDQK